MMRLAIRAFFALGFGLLVLLSGCASLPDRPQAPQSRALEDVEATALSRIAAASVVDHPGLSGFRLLPEGETALNARIALMRRAEKSLDVQYYLIRDDEVGLLFLRELRDAARRGVRVRLLVDDLYTAGEEDLLSGLAACPNVEVRLFNPLPARFGPYIVRVMFSAHEFTRINHRMHNKLVVADNSFAVSGGRNIAAEYFMRSASANFIDLDILSSGPIVRELSAVFDSYWNSRHVWPVASLVKQRSTPAQLRTRLDQQLSRAPLDVVERPQDVLGQTPLALQLDGGKVSQKFASAIVYADTPDKVAGLQPGSIAGTVTEKTLAAFARAREHVNIVSPYFIPGQRGMAMIKAVGATEESGRITLVTNSLAAADEPLVHSGYSRYRLEMLKAGVRIHELSPSLSRKSGRLGNFGSSYGRLHAKTAVIDHRWLLIGSMNLDARSAYINTEASLEIDSPELATTLSEMAIQALNSGAYRLRLTPDCKRIEWVERDAEGRETVHADEPEDNWIMRLRLWVISKLVPESLL